MSQYLVRYAGFARTPGVCHVVVARDTQGEAAVLVGELEDNPGTSTINAIEQIAALISKRLLTGSTSFSLYQYALVGIPEPEELRPTFYRVRWEGGRAFAMPVWDVVEPDTDPWLRHIKGAVKPRDYTMNALLAELDRNLELVDGVAEPIPWAS
ncbi:MAG: hypothetical protein JO243_00660 [Solirubrobacterales bacterium]|nr:hypothetical protein [Solirubrobacterales bacterium]